MNRADTELNRFLICEGVSFLGVAQRREAELDQHKVLNQLTVGLFRPALSESLEQLAVDLN